MALWLTDPGAYRQQVLINYAVVSAKAQHVDSNKFLELISCESRWQENAKGDYRIETDEYMASGLLQWWKSSFEAYSKKFSFKGKHNDPFSQIDLAVLVIAYDEKGIDNWLNCSKHIGWKKSKILALR